MRPIKLKISGLNSYIDIQDIDFEKLTERGLFGIFGPTGSGKSSILDAITIAMYGKIPRDTKEFINSESDVASISYEFEIGVGSKRKRYLIDRNIKRDNKSGGYKTSLARMIEVLNDKESNVLCDKPTEVSKKVEEILGLTCSDFTRSVVIPQGKFNDFLKLTGQDRRNMLERIFNLERYGKNLVMKIRSAKNKEVLAINELNGKLSNFEGVSEEELKKLQQEYDNLLLKEKELKSEKNKLEKNYKSIKEIWDKQKELQQYILKKQNLDKNISLNESNKLKVKKGKEALIVKPYILDLKETINKYDKNKIELETIISKLEIEEMKLKKLEAKYNEILRLKNDELPNLIEKKSKLIQSIDILDNIRNISNEVDVITQSKQKCINEIDKLNISIEDISKEKSDVTNTILETENNIEKIKISSEYREKVFKAFESEKEYKNLSNIKLDKEKKINSLKISIEDKNKSHTETLENKNKVEKELKELMEKYKSLETCFPGDNNTLLIKNRELNEAKESLKTATENTKNKEILIKKLDIINENKNKLRNILDLEIVEKNNKENELESISKKIEEININNIAITIAKDLKESDPCPVCGSIHHPSIIKEADNSQYEKLLKLKESLLNEIKIIIEKINNQKLEFSKLEAENDINNKELEKINELLKNYDINELKEFLEKKEVEFTKLNNDINNWNENKKKYEEKLNILKDNKSNLELNFGKISESLNNDKASLSEIEAELKSINENYKMLEERYIGYKNGLNLENIEVKVIEISKNDKLLEKYQKELKSYTTDKEKLDNNSFNLNNTLNELNINKAKCDESTREKKENMIKLQKNLKNLYDGNDPKGDLDNINRRVESINKDEENLKKSLETQQNITLEIKDKKTLLNNNDVNLKIDIENKKTKLNNMLNEYKFNDLQEVTLYDISKEDIINLENDINNFEKEYNNILSSIESIKIKLDGKKVDEKECEETEIRLNSTIKLLEEKVMEIGASKKSINDMEKNIDIVKDLKSQYNKISKKLDLLEDLDKLVQGNKFVEFVASNQLKYVSKEASKKLKDITRGRYALEINSSGNFIMRDDFNGGSRRATDTLSGGETFLTSLSLALALSSQIQLKGSAPLEFFFLDEGFGSLDKDLLEIVIDSLEKLHNDKLRVGIISHVEELKSRVPVKLIVNPADYGGNGSKVSIEYS